MIKAAAVQVDITPPVGCSMAGYMERKGASVGLHDPLKAQALVLSCNGKTHVIVTLDLIAVALPFTDAVRSFAAEKLQIEGQDILLACSHTHSGPQGFLASMPSMQEKSDQMLVDITLRKITGAIQWASSLLQPVKLSIGSDVGTGIGLNRNDPMAGSIDQQVIMLRVDDLEGKPIAVLFNYGCHATVMGSENRLISADFPGAARRTLESLFPGTIFMFCNGGAGDVSTRFTRRKASFDEVQRFGHILAAAVSRAMNTAEASQSTHLASRRMHADLPVKPFPTKETIERMLAELRDQLVAMRQDNQPKGEQRKLETCIEGAEIQMLLAAHFENQPSVQAELKMHRIGDLILIAIPGEPFSKTVLDIKAHFQPNPVMVVSYANDYKGYIPEVVEGKTATYEDFVSPYTGGAAQAIKQAIMAVKE